MVAHCSGWRECVSPDTFQDGTGTAGWCPVGIAYGFCRCARSGIDTHLCQRAGMPLYGE